MKLQAWLNLLRFLASPQQKLIAHLTVRGPYRQRYAMIAASRAIKGHTLQVIGADMFLGPGQATAILTCAPDEALRKVWYKPDYPGFNPHMTISDGLPESLTREILAACSQIRPFRFVSTPLVPIITKPPQAELSLANNVDFELLGQILGSAFDAGKVYQAQESTRLEWLRKTVVSQPS